MKTKVEVEEAHLMIVDMSAPRISISSPAGLAPRHRRSATSARGYGSRRIQARTRPFVQIHGVYKTQLLKRVVQKRKQPACSPFVPVAAVYDTLTAPRPECLQSRATTRDERSTGRARIPRSLLSRRRSRRRGLPPCTCWGAG